MIGEQKGWRSLGWAGHLREWSCPPDASHHVEPGGKRGMRSREKGRGIWIQEERKLTN